MKVFTKEFTKEFIKVFTKVNKKVHMKKPTFPSLLLLSLLMSVGLAPSAVAGDIDQDDAIRLKQTGEILPLESILEKARQRHDGKVIGVELEREHGSFIYEIKMLDNEGLLWEMKINARDGAVLEEEQDD
jgi:uncharacterized membrane protein YkoI